MNNQPVYIIDALRTPMGRANGRLCGITLPSLITKIIEKFVQKYTLEKKMVDEVIFGNAVSAGTGQNCIRKALIDAGLPESVPGYIVRNVCASGLQAIINASQAIRAGDSDLIITGGAESVSNMPELIFKKSHDLKKIKNLTESLMNDGLWCSVSDRWMGLLCEDLARKEKISKKEQDDYAFLSYQKAAKAQEQGDFQQEMIAIRMGGDKICTADETIRKNISRDVFDTFDGAFEYKGTVTAANSAAPCDGAAGCLLASQKAVEKYSFQPLASIVAYVSFAGSPKETFSLQEQAINVCLNKAGLALSQIDLFEISEAFATQMVYTQRKLNISDKNLNISGGDIALGHPLGAAGARAVVTLAHALKREHKRYGLACACLGGGGVLAMIIKSA